MNFVTGFGYVRKEEEFNKEQKLVEYGHMKRTISLMKINEELNREIKVLKRDDKEELGLVSNRLRDRIKELNCLYDISSLRDGTSFSLDDRPPSNCRFHPYGNSIP